MNKLYKTGLMLAAIAGLAVLMAYFAGVFHSKIGPAPAAEAYRLQGAAVLVEAVEVPVYEVVAGTVQATSDTILASRIMARVERVNVRAGEEVAQDAILIELDDEALVAANRQRNQAVEAAAAQLEEAQRNQNRISSLRASGNVSQAMLDQANTALRQANAQLLQAEQAAAEAATAVSYARITAPMAGKVVEHYVESGDMAAPGAPLVKLFNPGQMRVEATVRESLIRHVSIGQSLLARLDALQEQLSATVEEIVPASDPSSRTFLLKAHLSSTNGLFPGMFVRLSIPIAMHSTVQIPAAAVHSAGQLDFVYVREDEADQRRFVRLGDRYDDRVEIRSGLNAGEQIVLPDTDPR